MAFTKSKVTIVHATSTGTVPVGRTKIWIQNQGGAAATFDGQTYNPGDPAMVLEAQPGTTFKAISYDGTGTTLFIAYVENA